MRWPNKAEERKLIEIYADIAAAKSEFAEGHQGHDPGFVILHERLRIKPPPSDCRPPTQWSSAPPGGFRLQRRRAHARIATIERQAVVAQRKVPDGHHVDRHIRPRRRAEGAR